MPPGYRCQRRFQTRFRGSLRRDNRLGRLGAWKEIALPFEHSFNKTGGANRRHRLHQDCVIAVVERKEVPGWGPWSIKAVHHCTMFTILMSCCGCVGGSFPIGRLACRQRPFAGYPRLQTWFFVRRVRIQVTSGSSAVTCFAKRVMTLMRPLLLHSSSTAKVPNARRVVHIEFAADELPG